jgi:hypothetical protein
MRGIRNYHMHQRTDRVDASTRQFHNIGARSFDLRSFDLRSSTPISFDDEQLLTRGLVYAIE